MPDASAAALLFADPEAEPRTATARQALADDPAWAVPEHWRLELLSTIRGLWLGAKLDDDRAQRAVSTLARMRTLTIPTETLQPRVWQLRSSLSTYDAAYVAAAELRQCTLVTADARIERAGVARCPIHVIA